MTTTFTKTLSALLFMVLLLPLLTFAQEEQSGVIDISDSQNVEIEEPAFMKNLKTQEDFDNLTPAQQKEVDEYLLKKFESAKLPATATEQPEVNTVPEPTLPTPETTDSSWSQQILIFFLVVMFGLMGFVVFRNRKKNT